MADSQKSKEEPFYIRVRARCSHFLCAPNRLSLGERKSHCGVQRKDCPTGPLPPDNAPAIPAVKIRLSRAASALKPRHRTTMERERAMCTENGHVVNHIGQAAQAYLAVHFDCDDRSNENLRR